MRTISTIFLDDLEQKLVYQNFNKKVTKYKNKILNTSIWEFKKELKSLGRKHFDDNKKFNLQEPKSISGYLSTTFGRHYHTYQSRIN